jgi:hypothetical protein
MGYPGLLRKFGRIGSPVSKPGGAWSTVAKHYSLGEAFLRFVLVALVLVALVSFAIPAEPRPDSMRKKIAVIVSAICSASSLPSGAGSSSMF